MTSDGIRKRAHNHKWLPDKKHWSCEDDIDFLLAELDRTKARLKEARRVVQEFVTMSDDAIQRPLKLGRWDVVYKAARAFLEGNDD